VAGSDITEAFVKGTYTSRSFYAISEVFLEWCNFLDLSLL